MGTGTGSRSVRDELLRRWNEPHRSYHTVSHLAAVLGVIDDVAAAEPEADPMAVELAAWFHDVVYDPRRADNEEASAALAAGLLPPIGVEPKRVAAVVDLVRMTKTHTPTNAEARVLSDADLAVLARPARDYDAYVAAVREEYAFVPDDGWRRGRAAVLDGLLARVPLYSPAPMQQLERAARANLTRELRDLRGH